MTEHFLNIHTFSRKGQSLKVLKITLLAFFHDGGPYHTETSPLIRRANQWTGFYMIGTSVMKELKVVSTIY